MNIENQIKEILTQILPSEYFVVEINFINRLSKSKLTILLDGDQGIGIDQCAEASRQLSEKIDELDLISSAYTLEVSSPGVDKPLILKRQFPQHVGRKIKIWRADGDEQTGVLQAVDLTADCLAILPEMTKKAQKQAAEPLIINLNEIKKAQVLISFN
jgi:ribosome maturation factor RimP